MKPFCRDFAMLATGCALALGGAAHAASSRYSWVIDSIHGYNHPFAAQLPGELKIKMQKMRASPFAFYRGTAHLFFADMATLPASAYAGSSTAQTWLNGDMHLANLGAFRDDSGNFVYDTTDFDEGYWGQYVWDLRRMAVSIVLAARENGLSSTRQEQLVRDFADAYDSTLIPYSNDKEIDDWVNGHKPEFKSELVEFAANYARQVELDHQGFADAYDNGVPLY